MTYNPRISNINNNINLSGSVLINKLNTILSASIITSSQVIASNVEFNTIQTKNLNVILNSIQTNINYITGNITLNNTYHTIFADASSGSFTVNLPQISTAQNQEYVIKKVDSTTNSINIAAYSGQLIDGNNSIAITTENLSLVLINDATASWHII